MGNLVDNIDTIREMLDQSAIEIHTVSFLPNVQVVIGIVEVVHPVILRCPALQKLKYSPAVITLRNKCSKFEPSRP